jgi:hypothetical protein
VGEIPAPVAAVLGAAAARLPADQLVAAVRDGSALLDRVGGLLGPLGQVFGLP